jgi:hypothetical protein
LILPGYDVPGNFDEQMENSMNNAISQQHVFKGFIFYNSLHCVTQYKVKSKKIRRREPTELQVWTALCLVEL